MILLKRVLFISCFFFLSPWIAFGQAPLLPVYEIRSDTLTTQYIDSSYWQVLADETGKLAFAGIINSNVKEQFHFVSAGHPASANRVNTYWFRYRLKNTMNKNAAISLGTDADQCDFYVTGSTGEMKHYMTGGNTSWSKKDGLKDANAIPLILSPGQDVLIYQRQQDVKPAILKNDTKITLYSTNGLEKSELHKYELGYIKRPFIYDSFFSGLFFLAAIFNILIYWQVKDKVYLYFSLFLLFIAVLYQPALLHTSIIDHYHLVNFFASVTTFWMLFFQLFVKQYFDLATTHPRWNKFVIVASLIFAIIMLLNALPFDFENNIVFWKIRQFCLLGYFLSIIPTIVLGIRKPGQSRRFFVIAMFPFVLALVLVALILPLFLKASFFNYDMIGYIIGTAIAWGVIVFSSFLFKRYGEQQKQIIQDQLNKERERNEFIAEQKVELEKQVTNRTLELKQSFEDLKATQSQLVHSEKMASLGELTAGIAHEIQNPLNFVNNFSELNRELLSEMKDEIEFGNMTNVNALADDIISNEAKINHHGRRADAIVKGMLEHSRGSSSKKELSDINALADEYLRLAYHGLKAKDNSFNVATKTDFDNTIGKINIIGADIGKVIFNLITNACYTPQSPKGGVEQRRIVSVSTKKVNGYVEIKVSDNGPGIPKNILHKIFQPFFTTKPTGQGTGLGLSLSYDIVKAHGGELKVESVEGVETVFTICLPVPPGPLKGE